MKLTRWAVSILDADGKRVPAGLDTYTFALIYRTRKIARDQLSDVNYHGGKPRVERVLIDIPGIE